MADVFPDLMKNVNYSSKKLKDFQVNKDNQTHHSENVENQRERKNFRSINIDIKGNQSKIDS